MRTTNAIKGFDALKMKEEIQSANYEKTKNMSREEVRVYRKSKIVNDPILSGFVQKITQKPKPTPSANRIPSRKKKTIA
jgi:hypothetical protein